MHIKQTAILVLAAVACAFSLAVCGCAATDGGESAGFRQVSAAEAQAMIESAPDAVVLDVRTQDEYDSGHIPGAVCVPNETIDESFSGEFPDKSQAIFVYCRSGNRSVQAAEKLANMGYTNVVEFGGINDWPGEVVE